MKNLKNGPTQKILKPTNQTKNSPVSEGCWQCLNIVQSKAKCSSFPSLYILPSDESRRGERFSSPGIFPTLHRWENRGQRHPGLARAPVAGSWPRLNLQASQVGWLPARALVTVPLSFSQARGHSVSAQQSSDFWLSLNTSLNNRRDEPTAITWSKQMPLAS